MKKDHDQWASALIGIPWVSGARGPDSFDCWGLVRHVFLQQRGLELNVYEGLNAKDLFQVADVSASEEPFWQEIKEPQGLCLVAMSKRRIIHHVGVWLPGAMLVLHCMDASAVVAQNLFSLRASGFTTIRFYQPKS